MAEDSNNISLTKAEVTLLSELVIAFLPEDKKLQEEPAARLLVSVLEKLRRMPDVGKYSTTNKLFEGLYFRSRMVDCSDGLLPPELMKAHIRDIPEVQFIMPKDMGKRSQSEVIDVSAPLPFTINLHENISRDYFNYSEKKLTLSNSGLDINADISYKKRNSAQTETLRLDMSEIFFIAKLFEYYIRREDHDRDIIIEESEVLGDAKVGE